MRLWIGMVVAALPATAFAAKPTSNSASNINPGEIGVSDDRRCFTMSPKPFPILPIP